MTKTREQIEKLKAEWRGDPAGWDIEETEGFESHKDELLAFRMKWEAKWEQERVARKAAIDAKADKLGLRGLYRLALRLQERIEELEEQAARK